MDIVAVLVALAIGAIAGWLAGLLVEGAGFGLLWNILIGIAGAFPEIRARFDPRRRHCWCHCGIHDWRGCLASDRQSDPTARQLGRFPRPSPTRRLCIPAGGIRFRPQSAHWAARPRRQDRVACCRVLINRDW